MSTLCLPRSLTLEEPALEKLVVGLVPRVRLSKKHVRSRTQHTLETYIRSLLVSRLINCNSEGCAK